jgi:hypothetical protein
MNALTTFQRGAVLALLLSTAGAHARSGESPTLTSGTLQRAEILIRGHAFGPAADSLSQLLSVDPSNRRAKELLAFALESTGELERELRVRAALAAEYAGDAGTQADYGRALERSGDDGAALQAYSRARKLSANAPAPGLDAAIERMRGRTAVEIGMPALALLSDPDATATSEQLGAAIPFGTRDRLSLLAKHSAAAGRAVPGAKTQSGSLALTLVHRQGPAGYWTVGPRLHVVSPPGGAHTDLGVGGALLGRTPMGPWLEADWRGEVETPWEDAAITMLLGGRVSSAEGHVYVHGLERRVLLQLGARRRQLSIMAADPGSEQRPRAWQSLVVGGADLVVWRSPSATVRGEMFDETLVAPVSLSSAVRLAYRHYDISTWSMPEFSAQLGLAPRGSVDEASAVTTLVSARGGLGLELRAGLSRDVSRSAREWRAGGAVVWAPSSSTRLMLGYDEASELSTGLPGRRRAGGVSLHVDL